MLSSLLVSEISCSPCSSSIWMQWWSPRGAAGVLMNSSRLLNEDLLKHRRLIVWHFWASGGDFKAPPLQMSPRGSPEQLTTRTGAPCWDLCSGVLFFRIIRPGANIWNVYRDSVGVSLKPLILLKFCGCQNCQKSISWKFLSTLIGFSFIMKTTAQTFQLGN